MLCALGHAYGDETPSRTNEMPIYEDITKFAMAEGVGAVVFGVISNNPEAWGKVYLVTSPLLGLIAAGESRSPWVTLVGATTFAAAYGSWLMANDDQRRTTLWRKQMAAFNVLLLTGWVIYQFEDRTVERKDERPAAALRFIPNGDGGALAYERRF